MKPDRMYHFDWGTEPNKRWYAQAVLDPGGGYTAFGPEPLGNPLGLISSIRRGIGRNGCALVGFDFPIGIPVAYARLAEVKSFKAFFTKLGTRKWSQFYHVARERSEISVRRPFYPYSPGGKRQVHLLEAFGLHDIDELRRECEKKQEGRRAACPLFWTLGANQVGKGAIVGWRDVLAPALRNGDVSVWPFEGDLDTLLLPGKIVVVETYPAECYSWFLAEPLKGKGKQEVRRKASGPLLKWASAVELRIEAALRQEIEQGFPEGDDAFDAVVGLFGMIEVVSGRRQPGEPRTDTVSKWEGWILGQSTK